MWLNPESQNIYKFSVVSILTTGGTWGVYVNNDMIDELGLDSPYDKARNGAWTFEELKRYSAAAANLNGDASFDFDVNGNATYGLSNMNTAHYLAYGFGARAVTLSSDGKYEFTGDTNASFKAIWAELGDLFSGEDGLVFNGDSDDFASNGYIGVFASGRTLFLHGEIKNMRILPYVTSFDFGILPQPKYSAEDSYNSNIFNACLAYCIPTTNKELDVTAEISNFLAAKSNEDVMPVYMGIITNGDADSTDMIDIIRTSTSLEPGMAYAWTTGLTNALNNAIKNGNASSIPTVIADYKADVEANIKATYDLIGN